MLLILQKSLKSLQARLHEFLWDLAGPDAPAVEASAFTHARAKLKASAFVELNQLVLQTVYGSDFAGLVQRWHGHRLLGVDSSLMRLPSHAEVGQVFGWVQCANHRGLQERYPQGRVSVLYDVRNEVALDSCLVGSTVAETELAHQHLAHVQPGDVLLTDRGYTGYGWVAAVRAREAHFVSRCSQGSFAAVQQLFARNEENVSVEVTLLAPKGVRAQCREQGWPLELCVRLVTVRLPSGELEVLATSLLDQAAYSNCRTGGRLLGTLGARNLLWPVKGPVGPGTLQRQDEGGSRAGFCGHRALEQHRERAHRARAGRVGSKDGAPAAARAGEPGGERACS